MSDQRDILHHLTNSKTSTSTFYCTARHPYCHTRVAHPPLIPFPTIFWHYLSSKRPRTVNKCKTILNYQILMPYFLENKNSGSIFASSNFPNYINENSYTSIPNRYNPRSYRSIYGISPDVPYCFRSKLRRLHDLQGGL